MEQPNLERRRGADLWSRAVRWITVGGWVFFLVALFAFERARPEQESFFHRLYSERYGTETAIRRTWDSAWLDWVPNLLLVALLVGFLAVIVGILRSRRREDPMRIWALLLVAAASAGLLTYVVTISA